MLNRFIRLGEPSHGLNAHLPAGMALSLQEQIPVEGTLEPETLAVGDIFYGILPDGTISVYRVEPVKAISLTEQPIEEWPIEALGLSTLATNTLKKRAHVTTIGDLRDMTKRAVRTTRLIGENTFNDIESALSEHNLSLRTD